MGDGLPPEFELWEAAGDRLQVDVAGLGQPEIDRLWQDVGFELKTEWPYLKEENFSVVWRERECRFKAVEEYLFMAALVRGRNKYVAFLEIGEELYGSQATLGSTI